MKLSNRRTALALLVITVLVAHVGNSVAHPVDPGPAQVPPFAYGAAPTFRFVDVSEAAGVAFEHALAAGAGMPEWASGGAAAADFDGDGWSDLILVRGERGPVLLRNQRDGTFARVQGAGLGAIDGTAAGPTFADFNGDGRLDILVAGLAPRRVELFAASDGRFVRQGSGLISIKNTFSSAFGDIDRDGDLDLALAHWDTNCRDGCGGDHVWRNDGGGSFAPVADALAGFETDHSFTPNFADLNSDGWPDLLVAADLGTSQVFLNDGTGRFVDATDRDVITDRAGMGASVGDYDNDGDLDWFVTSITSADGNRLYRNRGDGVFDDVTGRTRVRDGGWGWGACFADFDNDGWLDIAHVNGWRTEADDATRLFMNQKGKRFRERAEHHGLSDRASGRGIVCFDYDRDGDVDLLVQNSEGTTRLYRNDGGSDRAWLTVNLDGSLPNAAGVGARVHVTTEAGTQMRELRCGNNYVSQDPIEAHFGLGSSTRVRKLRVVWPDGATRVLRRVAPRQLLTIEHPGAP